MTLSYPLKNYSWQQIARPMLLLSIGIHGLLLLAPMPTEKAEPTKKNSTQNKIKITRLPISSNSQRNIKKPSNSAVTSSIIRQTNKPIINPQKSINQPVIKNFTEVASKPTQNLKIASTPAETVALPNPYNLNDPFEDFPQYINSQPGSSGLFTAPIDQSSQQTQDSVDMVAEYFERELKAREYKITIAKNEADAKVFEIKKGNTTKFLNLITHNSKTVIVLASEILNPENINDVTKVSPEEEAFISILNKIEFETIDQPELYLSEPGLFYTKFGADKDGFLEMEQKSNTIGTIRLIPNQLPEQVFNTVFAPTLETSNFEINPQKKYGGGMIYEVKQGNFVAYLNLVPTNDRQSTIVVAWSSIP